MTSHYPSELDADSVTSSPRSDHFHEPLTRVRFMCSFGGKILPRPHDNQLRYVGGDTRIVAVHRTISCSALIQKLSKLSGMTNIAVKYQLPTEDLDALISLTTDEDVENMMDEYERLAQNQNPRFTRLRLFLFPEGADSRSSSISSLLNGSDNRENWFVDALNGGGGAGLERGRSEASSLVSEVPDYLFGLDNFEETHPREPRSKDRPVLQDNIYCSDPGSPAPVVSSPFCSTSSAPCVPSIPNLPPVKTKTENPVPIFESNENQTQAETGERQQPNPHPSNPVVHYAPGQEAAYSGHPEQPVPIYYVPGPVQPRNVAIQHAPIRAPYPYVQQPYHALAPTQYPIGYHQLYPGLGQIYGGEVSHVTPVHPYNATATVVQEGVKQPVYQPVPNSTAVPIYPVMKMSGGDEPQRAQDGSGHQRGK